MIRQFVLSAGLVASLWSLIAIWSLGSHEVLSGEQFALLLVVTIGGALFTVIGIWTYQSLKSLRLIDKYAKELKETREHARRAVDRATETQQRNQDLNVPQAQRLAINRSLTSQAELDFAVTSLPARSRSQWTVEEEDVTHAMEAETRRLKREFDKANCAHTSQITVISEKRRLTIRRKR